MSVEAAGRQMASQEPENSVADSWPQTWMGRRAAARKVDCNLTVQAPQGGGGEGRGAGTTEVREEAGGGSW